MNRRRFLTITAAAAMAPGLSTAEVQGRRRIAMGAETEIRLFGPHSVTAPALAEAERTIDRMDALFSLYRPESVLSRLNTEGMLDAPPAEMVELLGLCGRLHRVTGGRFDPTVQPLWRALAEGRDPAPVRALVGFDRVLVSQGRISLAPGQALTLNGIAQGYATDRVTEVLARHGLDHALVQVGEHRALGGPWRLGLVDPTFGQLGQIALGGRAVATSSPAALPLAGGGHILSPSGEAAAVWSTVSVVAETAALADGLSTGLCFANVDEIAAARAALAQPLAIRLVDDRGDLISL